MRTLLVSFILVISLCFASYADEKADKDCKECEIGCNIIVPAGDGCNTCDQRVYCVNGKWYSAGIGGCTLMYCPKMIDIPNPFKSR